MRKIKFDGELLEVEGGFKNIDTQDALFGGSEEKWKH